MTKLTYEKDGFALEQRFSGKEYKSYIYFDDVTRKTGYLKKTNYFSLIISILLIAYTIYTISFTQDRELTVILNIILILIFGYDFVTNFSRYKTLIIKKTSPIYFNRKEYGYIDEIIKKRDEYFRNVYYKNINSYEEDTRVGTLNWLYTEEAITMDEALGCINIEYDKEKQLFKIKE